ncbi:hypothetical protein [Saccharicrinis aurantiacus]|uniref:hypothetical protein n=1 Tax=Saccharicrinis aurantiacus TaxID=1849719 RepID=UPI000950309C|nr:hypothetical protein [Saccharicrinis aurantiacus]
MIDKWLKQDIEEIYKSHSIAVFIDESKEASFLIDELKSMATIYETYGEIEELKAKYEIEKAASESTKFIIYTNTPKNDLKYIREYCETNGCIEVRYLDHYIKKKVNQHLNLNINIPKEELISAAKVSVGQNQTYWMDLSHKGASEIFDLEKELLPFLDNPTSYLKKYDDSTQEIFFKKVNELIGQSYVKKPAKTLAKEVVEKMLNGLLHNSTNAVLFNVYKNWLDSLSYKASFQAYLEKYKIAAKSNVFEVHPSHPFRVIDEEWLKEIGKNINDKQFIQNVLPKINQRNADKAAKSLGISFWANVKELIEFDEKNINQISSFDECIGFYIKNFSKVDGAIRKLYSEFLTEPIIIEPLQTYYKNLSVVFLDKWFKYINNYQPNQLGKIQEIIDSNSTKTAIVVGDGVSWEFAQDIISNIHNKDYRLTEGHLLAGLPSETEHNMSQLYVNTGEVLSTKKERENYLAKSNNDKDISFVDLENVNEITDKAHYLICSYKEPDKLGETYQQKALKYFNHVAEVFASKIQQLLKNGYKTVYLLTDHGFTLTGILENSDKIEVGFSGTINKSERYIRSVNKQSINEELLIEKELKYEHFDYCYFAKRLGPFKTPGVYGFSHGGISPQETIIPYLKWTNTSENNELLSIKITNKSDLIDVTGNLFTLKLSGHADSKGLFTNERKIILLFFANNQKFNESDIITVNNDQELKKEYQFGSHSEIEIKVLDANTKEQLDKVTVKQSSARDLGGLL